MTLEATVDPMTVDARYAGDDRLYIVFSIKAEQNLFRSEQEGRPIFDDVPHVRIHTPGDKNSVIERPVVETDKVRFASRWEKFQKGLQMTTQGTPLEEWPVISTGMVHELKALNIYSVEQLAELADNHVQRFMGGVELRRKAQTFLKVSKDTAEAQRLATANAELEARLAAQDEQLRALAMHVKVLQEANAAPPAAALKGQADGNAERAVRRGAQ